MLVTSCKHLTKYLKETAVFFNPETLHALLEQGLLGRH
jgi:hypothetical protein